MGTGSRGCGRSHLRHSRGRISDGRRAMAHVRLGRRKLRGAFPPGRRRAMPARTDTLERSEAWAPIGARTLRPIPIRGEEEKGATQMMARSAPALVETARPLVELTAEAPTAPPTPGGKSRAGPREPGEAHWLRHAGLGRPIRPRSTAREPAPRRQATALNIRAAVARRRGDGRPPPRWHRRSRGEARGERACPGGGNRRATVTTCRPQGPKSQPSESPDCFVRELWWTAAPRGKAVSRVRPPSCPLNWEDACRDEGIPAS